MKTIPGSEFAAREMQIAELDQLFASIVAGEVVIEEGQMSYEVWRSEKLSPQHWGNSAMSKYADWKETRHRDAFFIADREVSKKDVAKIHTALAAREAAPELVERFSALEARSGWTHIHHEDSDLTNSTCSVKFELQHFDKLGLQVTGRAEHARYCIARAEKLLPDLDALEARRTDGCLPFFGGWVHTSGQSGRAAYWVVMSDGSLRQPDRNRYSRSHQRGDHSQWWLCVEQDEVALEWGKSSNASSHDFVVHKLPQGGCTPAQLAAVGSLEDNLEREWEGRTGFSSGIASPPVGDGWGLNAPRAYRLDTAQKAEDNGFNPDSPFAKLSVLREQMSGK